MALGRTSPAASPSSTTEHKLTRANFGGPPPAGGLPPSFGTAGADQAPAVHLLAFAPLSDPGVG